MRPSETLNLEAHILYIHTRTHTHTHTHTHKRTQTHTRAPRIDFDEVELHRVSSRGQHKGLCYVRSFALDIVTATYLLIAACSNLAAVPALKIVRIVEVTLDFDSSNCCSSWYVRVCLCQTCESLRKGMSFYYFLGMTEVCFFQLRHTRTFRGSCTGSGSPQAWHSILGHEFTCDYSMIRIIITPIHRDHVSINACNGGVVFVPVKLVYGMHGVADSTYCLCNGIWSVCGNGKR